MQIRSSQFEGGFKMVISPDRPEKPVRDVQAGDAVQDPLDGTYRKVTAIRGNTIHFADGGVMGLDEITRDTRILLPSEQG